MLVRLFDNARCMGMLMTNPMTVSFLFCFISLFFTCSYIPFLLHGGRRAFLARDLRPLVTTSEEGYAVAGRTQRAWEERIEREREKVRAS